MELKPGQSTEVTVTFMMHKGMDSFHDFRLHVISNDPEQPDKEREILSNWVE